ncbi:MAG: hypothetical protein HUK24_02370 [Sphaerochaetaceae bacterium]|nr:hypothetical protein [Sphaerochaetaceae bacterium]
MERTELLKTASEGLRALATILDDVRLIDEKYDLDSLLKNLEKPQATLFEAQPISHITMEDLRAKLIQKARNGHHKTVEMLLHKYGVKKISELKETSFEGISQDSDEYCRDITKEEISEAIEHVRDTKSEEYLQGLFEHHYATCLEDLKPLYYASFLWDARRA